MSKNPLRYFLASVTKGGIAGPRNNICTVDYLSSHVCKLNVCYSK